MAGVRTAEIVNILPTFHNALVARAADITRRDIAQLRLPLGWLDEPFTLGELHQLCETVLGSHLDTLGHQGPQEGLNVLVLCRRQLDFGDGLIAEEVGDLWEGWMRHIDKVLEDPLIVKPVYDALASRWTNSLFWPNFLASRCLRTDYPRHRQTERPKA